MSLVLALAPVLVFLVILIGLDSFKLVNPRSVLFSISVGCGAAVICLAANSWLLRGLAIDQVLLVRYAAPLIEEITKGVWLVYIIRTGRTGFVVDSALHGFALGAGFALIENIYYLNVVPNHNLLLWVVRGFGTAIVHGSTTAILGIIFKTLVDRREKPSLMAALPGLITAFAIHSFFNHFVLSPTLSTLLVIVLVPLMMVVVFERSGRMTQAWLGEGWEADVNRLEAISSGDITTTRVGQYLKRLRGHFPGKVVADMLCLLRLDAELAIAAKGQLLARQAGLKPPGDPEIAAKLVELRFLEHSIGVTGKLALKPLLRGKTPDVWQRHFLQRDE